MQQSKQVVRAKGSRRDSTKIKTKFLEERTEEVKSNALKPLNQKQGKYIELLETKPIVIATGFAGTSKTYIPTCMAADKFKVGAINKIIISRPAISSSKSIGFFTGSATEKLAVWLGPVVQILKERLGPAAYDIALAKGDIEFVPLEVVKGMSVNDAWLICEESSDLTKEEVIKLVTRMGKNSKLVLAGDVRQTELRETSGLAWLSTFVEKHNLNDLFGKIDFNETSDIVRSDAVKRFLIALVREESKSK
jgi:phosphate starvation-inducible protein PhoH and related proteins